MFLQVLRILMQHDSNPDTSDCHSQTPLHLACETDSLNCVKLIMNQSTKSLNALDDTGKTALHISCKNGNM